jgi:hypothetical protein
LEVVEAVAGMFKVDKQLSRLVKFAVTIESYLQYREKVEELKTKTNNITWSVAFQYPAVARIKNSPLGELIDNFIKDGFDIAKDKFLRMVDPLLYQRPKALPSSGNVAVAEKLIKELVLERSLLRRAVVDGDITNWFWQPPVVEETTETNSIFSKVKTKDDLLSTSFLDKTMVDGGPKTLTVFLRDILANVKTLSVISSPMTRTITGLTTAVNHDAPPLYRHDTLEERDPIAGFVFNRTTSLSDWGMSFTSPIPALGLYRRKDLETDGLLAVVRAGKYPNVGSCIFPEVIDRRLYEVRSVIEEYSKTTPLPAEGDLLVGFPLVGSTIAVIVEGVPGMVKYFIDRFE